MKHEHVQAQMGRILKGGLTQAKVSRLLQVSHAHTYRWVRGSSMPSDYYQAILDMLEKALDETSVDRVWDALAPAKNAEEMIRALVHLTD